MGKPRMLEGLKVVDFTWAIAGPFTARYLADNGATVVKVESARRVDAMRTFQPYKDRKPGINRSAVYAAMNSSKLSLGLNMTKPEAREIAKKLIAWCDIVVENFAPDAMGNWGLAYEDIVKFNENVIMISMSSMGATGPLAHYHGLGFHIQGFAGFCNITGFPDRSPFGAVAYTDFIGPPLAISALMGALDHRRRTGEGQHIDMAQVEGGIHFLGPAVLDYSFNNRDAGRRGNDSTYAAPHNAYACAGDDRWCVISVFTDEQWRALVSVVGDEALRDDRFATLAGRLERRREIDERLGEWTRARSPQEVMESLQTVGVPAGVVSDGADLEQDKQFAARNFYQHFDHLEIGDYTTRRQTPVLASDADTGPYSEAPMLGQHTEYVLTELLHIPDEKWVPLMEQGVFG